MKQLLYVLILANFANLQAQIEDINFFVDNNFVLEAIIENNIRREIEHTYRLSYEEQTSPLAFGIFPLKPGNLFVSLTDECQFEIGDPIAIRLYKTINILNDDYFEAIYLLESHNLPSECSNDDEINIFLSAFTSNHQHEVSEEVDFTKVNYTIDIDKMGFKLASEAMPDYILVFKVEEVAAIEKEALVQTVQIRYNKANKTVSIQAPKLTLSSFVILDALGREVLLTNKEFTNIPTGHLASGVYFVNISTSEGSITKQIIIH